MFFSKPANVPRIGSAFESVPSTHGGPGASARVVSRFTSRFRMLLPCTLVAALALATNSSQAADAEFALTIQNHKFTPAEVRVPSGQRVKLVVLNKDDTPEEFESIELNREKIIPGGNRATIFIGPLKPGRYPFFGEFHQSTAQGVVIAE